MTKKPETETRTYVAPNGDAAELDEAFFASARRGRPNLPPDLGAPADPSKRDKKAKSRPRSKR